MPLSKPTETPEGYKPGEGKMRAVVYHGKKDVRVETVDRPTISDPRDVIVKSTATTVCGSDLHLYHGAIPTIKAGDILGHEGIGVVDQVGAQVTKFKVGDRVLSTFSIGCGECAQCKDEQYSMCDRTNSSPLMGKLMGQKIGGVLGFSHLLGGFAGTQAEYFRIPMAEINCFKIPDKMPDEKAILLTDVSATAYHSVYDIDFKEGETAAVWGAGPIGQLISQWLLRVFKAKTVILIDNEVPRLDWAKDKLGVDTLNFDHVSNVAEEVMRRVPGGVDVSFDAAGFRYAKSFLHRAMQTLSLETDTPETLNECIRATGKRGRISVIADYVGTCSGFLIGALMEKGQRLQGNGQAPTQRYMDKIFEYVDTGTFDPSLILTHRFAFEDLDKAYKAFDEKRVDVTKHRPYLKAFVETTASATRADGTPQLESVPGF
ncbi:putative glutathione-dependent formaldehyde dehydrogenase [Testicularia cyperi]|uniref:Putative glutathione-dependent formaldehyde dehydrogenase n=1 Tax=Testicularia cyperi TaxID=1882483 RepID=A0A317XZ86_9BASI|nr:putative glutathione-dependent formaldehyde dehydrogenase [Testicularia cyperi]